MAVSHAPRGWIEILKVETETVTASDGACQLTLTVQHLAWRPKSDLANRLPANFQLDFQLISTGDGNRHFLPSPNAYVFALQASLIGHAILKQRGMTREQSRSYGAMRLIYQHANRVQEKLCRTFQRGGRTSACRTRSESILIGKTSCRTKLASQPLEKVSAGLFRICSNKAGKPRLRTDTPPIRPQRKSATESGRPHSSLRWTRPP